MSKRIRKVSKMMVLLLTMVMITGMTVYAEEDVEGEEDVSYEQGSFEKNDGTIDDSQIIDRYVDGIYNVSPNARANMSGVIRLYESEGRLGVVYSTLYKYTVDRIGVRAIKLQYQGSLGLWHNVITLDNEYRANASSFQGGFSCNGVVGRVYRAKGTHYYIDGDISEARDNVTDGLTFR